MHHLIHHVVTSSATRLRLTYSIPQASEQGIPEAISLLGYCYESGDGVVENKERAVLCYNAAVELGDPHAMVRLGRAKWAGAGCAKDPEGARKHIDEGMALLRARVKANEGEHHSLKSLMRISFASIAHIAACEDGLQS
jgi:TPR repeat protein